MFVAALAVLDAERSAPGSTITTFGTALWWAFETITTVGYRDFTPLTVTGRLIAGTLMLGGIALLGVVTATIAPWIVERVAIRALEQQVTRLRETLDRMDERAQQVLADQRDENPLQGCGATRWGQVGSTPLPRFRRIPLALGVLDDE